MATSKLIPTARKPPNVPDQVHRWDSWIRANNHCDSSLESIGPESASEAKILQFYMLRTLYQRACSCDRLEGGLPIDYTAARLVLASCPLWKDYQDSFTEGFTSKQVFGLARLYQQRSAHLGIGEAVTGRGFCIYKPEEPSVSQKPHTEGAILERTLKTKSSSLSQISVVEYDRTPKSQWVEDEEIVNFALVLFANSLISTTPSVSGDWLPCRSSSEVKIGNKKLYGSLVDGVFRVEKVSEETAAEQLRLCRRLYKTGSTASHVDDMDVDDNDESTYELSENFETTAIMEVKRKSRSNTANWCLDIIYQEAAEMAAWIAEVPMLLYQKPDQNGTYRRLLLSQDQREIYVTIALYTEKYISYILHSVHKPAYDKAALTTDHFLRMHPYGPFRVDVLEDMEKLARVLIALSYQNFVI